MCATAWAPTASACYGAGMDRDALARFMRFEHRTFRWNDGEDHSRYQAVESTDAGRRVLPDGFRTLWGPVKAALATIEETS